MAKTTWTGVSVSMSNTLPVAVTITGISKATQGVVLTATPPAAGSYVLINAQGMSQVNGKIFRVGTVVAGVSFVLESEDTTNYSTFSSGSYQLVAAGAFPNTLAQITTVSASGGEYDKIDTTLLADTVKSSIPGMASAVEYSLESVWDVSDAGLIAANAASRIQEQRGFMVTFRNNQRVVFAGTVGAELIPGGSTGGLVTTKLSITANGGQKAYAS